jgi:hypothetical protein
MSLFDLSVTQLKRAAAIKEQIEALNKELRSILGGPAKSGAAPKTMPTIGAAPAKTPTMSDAAKKKIAATQKARWAKIQGSKPATLPVKTAAKPNKTNMSAATRAKLSAKLKAFWAAKKAGKK